MGVPVPESGSQQGAEAPPAADGRLDSWKEIAAFLRRDVRTVQRWEKQAGLPVHRHANSRLRTAYAYRSELDAWWLAQREVVEDTPAVPEPELEPNLTSEPAPEPDRRRWRPGRNGAAALAGAALAVTMATVLVGRPANVPPPPAASSVTFLPIPFDDHTGDPALAALLDDHVVRELDRHPGVDALAPARIARTLRLMRRDPAGRLDPSIGSELALRDGQASLIITGRVHKADARVFVDIEAIEPADGRVRLSVEWHAATENALLAQVRRESPQLANQLLAAPAALPAPHLVQATTSSLPALRLYTAAVQAGRRRQWGAAELLAQRAVAADDWFAAAHAWVGWAMRQQGRPARKCLPPLQRASELAADVTDRESYFISGALHTVAGELPLAVAAFEALERLQPGNRDAVDLLIDAYTRAGRVKAAVELSVRRAEDAPQDFYGERPRRSRPGDYARRRRPRAGLSPARAQALFSSETIDDRPFWSAWLAVFPVFQQWRAGDRQAALAALAPIDRSLAGRLGHERDAFATAVGFAYLAFGDREQADGAFRQAATPVRQLNLAMLALTAGDDERARHWLSQIPQASSARPALFARAGLHREAEHGLERLPIAERSVGIAAVTRGLIAARRGRIGRAVAALNQGLDLLRFSGEPDDFFAVEALAGLAQARRDDGAGRQLLSEADAAAAHTYGPSQWTAGYWTKLRSDQAPARLPAPAP